MSNKYLSISHNKFYINGICCKVKARCISGTISGCGVCYGSDGSTATQFFSHCLWGTAHFGNHWPIANRQILDILFFDKPIITNTVERTTPNTLEKRRFFDLLISDFLS